MLRENLAVSVIIPVKNEAQNLPACLSSLDRFGEVLVIDSQSSDATCELAQKHGAEVIQFEWNGRYPKKRNWVLLNHSLKSEWVLFLDADEIVTEEFCVEVAEAISDGKYNGFWLNYTNYFLGRPLCYGDPQRKLALFRVGKGLYERIDEVAWSNLDMEIHEHPVIEGDVGEIKARIQHKDDRGLAKFIERHRDYAVWEVHRTRTLRHASEPVWIRLTQRQRAKYRNIDKWWFALGYFGWTYLAKRGFLDGAAGFYYAYYKLWYFWTIRLLIKEQEQP